MEEISNVDENLVQFSKRIKNGGRRGGYFVEAYLTTFLSFITIEEKVYVTMSNIGMTVISLKFCAR